MALTLIVDNPTIARLGNLYPDIALKTLEVYRHMYYKTGLSLRCTESIRSLEDQEKRYSQGRTAPGEIVTDAKPGDSLHFYGLAADSCFLGHDPYLERATEGSQIWQYFGDFCAMEDLEWGGKFQKPDRPHLQKRYGLSIQEIKDIFEDVGKEGLWREIDIIRKGEKIWFAN